MNKIDLAWLAGLLEGEGSFGFGNRHVPKSMTPRIQCHMTDRDVMLRVATLLGSKLYGPYKQPNRKRHWAAHLERWDETLGMMTALMPLMGTRRQKQIKKVLKYCSERRNCEPRKRWRNHRNTQE